MRFSATIKWAIPVAAAVLLAAWQSRQLAAKRQAPAQVSCRGYHAAVPPGLTFVLVGLGGFRGVVAEVLWFRASRLQDQGRYLELVQLADWITLLDPHAAEAWVYNAWNLAYNVSAMMPRAADRLRWVRSGFALLRDEGLRLNPREPRLYRELAWLYQNKVGDDLDPAHLSYKLDLAQAVSPFLNADGSVNGSPENRASLARLNLDGERMAELERRFGPLDWRLAETHALYWADLGVALATGHERLLCRRGVYQPLILSVFRGRFAGDLGKPAWKTEPNPALALPAADYLLQTAREFPSRNLTVVTLRFLARSLRLAHAAGQDAQAAALFERLLSALPPDMAKPVFAEVANGWEPPDE